MWYALNSGECSIVLAKAHTCPNSDIVGCIFNLITYNCMLVIGHVFERNKCASLLTTTINYNKPLNIKNYNKIVFCV